MGLCLGPGTCQFYFGSMLPLSAGGVSTSVINQFTSAIVGTADLETGTTATALTLRSSVFTGPGVDKPCNNCIGDIAVNDGVRDGTCDSGLRAGRACDVNGRHPIPAFNGGIPALGFVRGTSLDCAYEPATALATLPIDLSNSTGTESMTLSAASPFCSATGFTTLKCMCDTCNSPGGESCMVNTDCPPSGVCRGGGNALQYCQTLANCPDQGAGTSCGGPPCSIAAHCASGVCTGGICTTTEGKCGGLRCLGGAINPGAACFFPGNCSSFSAPCGLVGESTKPNACQPSAGACVATGDPNRGECATGPFNQFCTPTETFRGCAANSDCTFAGDTCGAGQPRPCFLDKGVIGNSINSLGSPDAPVNDTAQPTLASTFCVNPTSSGSVNQAAGLPGAGRVTLFGTADGLP
jgi:hypothetical protein